MGDKTERIKELLVELEKQREEIHRLKYGIESSYNKEKELSENYLQLFGSYGNTGIKIALDTEIKKQISDYIYSKMRSILESKKDFEDMFIKMALNYKHAFVNIFTPIVKEIIHDLDFNVSFKSYHKEE